MTNHIVMASCTAQLRNGNFCDLPTLPDMPFPICEKHASAIYRRISQNVEAKIDAARRPLSWVDKNQVDLDDHMDRRRAATVAQSVVYYLRESSGAIKIGFTTNMEARLLALRINRDAMLATEPGGRELERMRHRQFKHLRLGRWERFQPEADLLSHVAMIREHFGEPNITTYPKVS